MDIEHSTMDQLRTANERLQASLDKCHKLVAEYRSKLAANTDLPGCREENSDKRNAANRNS